jgi:sugar phosphate isomerase/epimerase
MAKNECARWVDYAGERGVILVAHNHIGGIETREELLRYLDERPGMYACPDTGHLALCGSDPVRTIESG